VVALPGAPPAGAFDSYRAQQTARTTMATSPAGFDESTLELLYPCVVPKSWVKRTDASLYWQFSKDVYLIVVMDGDDALSNVRPEDLDILGISQQQCLSIATDNLASAWERGEFEFISTELQDRTRIGVAQGNWMAAAGGLLLVDFFEGMKTEFGAKRFAAVALNQECLFAFPTDERTLGSTALLVAMEQQINSHRQPISRSLLLLDGRWPRAFKTS
jgi:hypothetical protein